MCFIIYIFLFIQSLPLSLDNRDQDFAPTRDMMRHEGYDDERTLEEEEAMSGGSCSNELDELQKVGLHFTSGCCCHFYLYLISSVPL